MIAAHILKLVTARQLIGEGDEINRLVPLEECLAGYKNFLVGFPVKMLRTKNLERLYQGIPIENNRSKDGNLRINILRGDPLKGLWRKYSHGVGLSRTAFLKDNRTLPAHDLDLDLRNRFPV